MSDWVRRGGYTYQQYLQQRSFYDGVSNTVRESAREQTMAMLGSQEALAEMGFRVQAEAADQISGDVRAGVAVHPSPG